MQMPGSASQAHYDWPYEEAMTLDEAMNELALFATGLQGKPLPMQNGAPTRAIIPWKYGLKSIKSIVEIEFTKKRPPTLRNEAIPHEDGWYSKRQSEQAAPTSTLARSSRTHDSDRRDKANFDVQRL